MRNLSEVDPINSRHARKFKVGGLGVSTASMTRGGGAPFLGVITDIEHDQEALVVHFRLENKAGETAHGYVSLWDASDIQMMTVYEAKREGLISKTDVDRERQ